MDRLDKVIRSVASSYRTFEYYQEHRDKVEKHTLEDFAVRYQQIMTLRSQLRDPL